MVIDQNGKPVKRNDLISFSSPGGTGGVSNLLENPDDGGGGGGGGSTNCTYTDNQNLYAKWFSSDNISRWESRLKGLPEITMRVFAPSTATNFATLGEIRRVDEMEEPALRLNGPWPWSNDAWFGPLTNLPNGISIVNWNSASFSKTLLFSFVEIDGGTSTIPVTISGNFKLTIPGVGESTRGLSVTFDIANNDDEIGKMVVDQCASPPQSGISLTNNQPFYDINTNFFVVLGN